MRVILRKAAHTEQAVQCTGQLMTVDKPKFADAQRQLTVGMRLGLINQHTARAVHRLDGEILFVDHGGVHVVFIMLPVAGAFPQLAAEDHRRGHLDIAVFLMHLAPVINQRIFKRHAIRQEERKARAFLGQHKQAEILTQTAVVALLRFLQHIEISVQLILLRESRAVNTLQHLVFTVAAPVCAGDIHQLHTVALDTTGRIKMRAGTQVGKVALLVERNGRVLRQVVDELHLVRLILLLHQFTRLSTRQLKTLQRQFFLADLLHLGLERIQMLLRERERRVKVIVEAVFDRRADCELHFRIQALDCLRQNMRHRVTVSIAVFRIFKRILVFFGHNCVPPSCFAGRTKKPTPDIKSGVSCWTTVCDV